MKKSDTPRNPTSYTGIRNSTQNHADKPKLSDEAVRWKKSDYVIPLALTFSIIAAVQWVQSYSNPSVETAPLTSDLSSEQPAELSNSNILKALLQNIANKWPEGSVAEVSEDLLMQASEAVAQEDNGLFGESMKLLGVNAMRTQDIDSASLYLDEALEVYEELGDEMGIANVELLRGELNLKRRAQARRAAIAYDALQLARWKVSHGQFYETLDQLHHIVQENLALNRFGAAAAAYQTIYKGYTDNNQSYEAQQAGLEIVKLHASSGRPLQASAMIEQLQANGLDDSTASQLAADNLNLQVEYEKSVMQMGKARDYQQLYHYFISAGDPVRAWQFRLKAQSSLRSVSKRAMHRRQTGVLALLYTSNDHMVNAKRSLARASGLFSSNDRPELSEASDALQLRVY